MLIGSRKYGHLSVFPKDIVVLLAKYLWETREEEVWQEETNNKRIKI
jgi:hypothetical protein